LCSHQIDKGMKDLVHRAALLHNVGSLQFFLVSGELDALLVSQSTGRCIPLISYIRCRNVLISGAAVAILNSDISHHVLSAARMHILGRPHQMKVKSVKSFISNPNCHFGTLNFP
jgi:hypothetical protein